MTTTRGIPLDLAVAPRSGFLENEASTGRIIDLSNYMDPERRCGRNSATYLVDAATLGSGLYGLPISAEPQGVVWYPLAAFTEAGYTVPGAGTS